MIIHNNRTTNVKYLTMFLAFVVGVMVGGGAIRHQTTLRVRSLPIVDESAEIKQYPAADRRTSIIDDDSQKQDNTKDHQDDQKKNQKSHDCSDGEKKLYCMSHVCRNRALAAAGISVLSLTILVSAVMPWLGFGALGIAEASVAAAWQAAIGNVAAGSIFSLLTSIGMAGLSGSAYVVVGGAGYTLAKELCDYYEAKN